MREVFGSYRVVGLVAVLIFACYAAEWTTDNYDFYRSTELRTTLPIEKLAAAPGSDLDLQMMQMQMLMEDRKAEQKKDKQKEASWASTPEEDDDFHIPAANGSAVGTHVFTPSHTFSTMAGGGN